MFNVVKTLSVHILIGADFIDKYVTGIYPSGRRLKPTNSITIAMILTGALDELGIAIASAQEEANRRHSDYTREAEIKINAKLEVAE